MASRTRNPQVEKASPIDPRAEERSRRRQRMQPPLTPMIDVTFQLLLFFLLTCEFRETEGVIPGSLPHIGPGRAAEKLLSPIEVTLHRSGQEGMVYYRLSGTAETIAGPGELYTRLRQRQEAIGSRDVPLLIHPEPTVPWEFVVEAFNQAVRAEFTKIAFARDDLAMLSSP